MPLSLVTAPASEPLTVAEARAQLELGAGAGEPAPAAPSAALANPAAPGNCDNGIWRFAWTSITAAGETDLGELSAPVTVADKTVNGQIVVTAPIGGSAVTGRKGYAIAPGESVAKLFATLTNNTATSATCNSAASALGVQAPTVNTTLEPELVAGLTSARIRGERASRRAWITQTWERRQNQFPSGSIIELPRPPLQSVSWIKYVDPNGDLQTLDPSYYRVITYAGEFCARGCIELAFGSVWPATRQQLDAVTIRFVAGYGAAADVPQLLRTAMKLDLTNVYANRGDEDAPMSSVSTAIYRSFKSYPNYPDSCE